MVDIRALSRLLLAQEGLNPDEHLIDPEEETVAAKERKKLGAEATLRHLIYPAIPFLTKDCKTCGHRFTTDYYSVAYCSNPCAKEALRYYGIDWEDKPLRKHYGGAQPPGIITPDALEAMANLLKRAGYDVRRPSEISSSEQSEAVEPQRIELIQIQTKSEILDVPIEKQSLEDSFEDLLADF